MSEKRSSERDGVRPTITVDQSSPLAAPRELGEGGLSGAGSGGHIASSGGKGRRSAVSPATNPYFFILKSELQAAASAGDDNAENELERRKQKRDRKRLLRRGDRLAAAEGDGDTGDAGDAPEQHPEPAAENAGGDAGDADDQPADSLDQAKPTDLDRRQRFGALRASWANGELVPGAATRRAGDGHDGDADSAEAAAQHGRPEPNDPAAPSLEPDVHGEDA